MAGEEEERGERRGALAHAPTAHWRCTPNKEEGRPLNGMRSSHHVAMRARTGPKARSASTRESTEYRQISSEAARQDKRLAALERNRACRAAGSAVPAHGARREVSACERVTEWEGATESARGRREVLRMSAWRPSKRLGTSREGKRAR